MKKMQAIIITSLLIACAVFCCACGRKKDFEKLDSRLNECFDKYVTQNSIESSCFRLFNQETGYNWSGSTEGVDDNSHFGMASITKMFTAVVIFNLESEGRISFDAPISKYLPKSYYEGTAVYKGTDYADRITIRQLLSHTSGLADYFSESSSGYPSIVETSYEQNRDIRYPYSNILARMRELPALNIPGESRKANYSDFNYQLLGKIIETVTRKSLNDNYKKYIYTPSGMKSTYLYEPDMKWGDIEEIRGKYANGEFPLMEASEQAAGGIISTAEDLMKFAKAYFSYTLFDESLFSDITSFKDLSFHKQYGLGLMHFSNIYDSYGHTGSLGCVVLYSPKLKTYVVGTVNNCSSKDALSLAKKLLSEM